MRLARLHRRLTVLMALAALVAFGAGFGLASPHVALAGAALAFALFWQAPPEWNRWMEGITQFVVALLFAWILYVTFVVGGDFLIPVLGLLLFILAGEALRPLDARNDLRLYSLAFALLIGATAYSPGPLFGGAFVAYIALATLALMVGHLRRQTERFGIAGPRIGRPFLFATAVLSGITMLMSIALFVIFPRLPRNWIGTARASASQVMAGFGDDVSLGEFGSRIDPNPEVVFRVEFSSGPPPDPSGLHWRGRSYDRFDGVRWTRTPSLPPVSPPPSFYRERWGAGTRSYQIFGGPPGVQIIFGLHPILEVSPRSRIRPVPERSGDLLYVGSDRPVYRVVSLASRPAEQALRAVSPDDPSIMAPYLQLPRLPARIAQLVDSLTRGRPTRYDRVRAVEHYLEREFRYTLELPATAAQTSLDHFLFERRAGHCEYFSTAMVVLLRSAGIPARNVNGFLGGEWSESGEYLAVTQNGAHSWVEVWFPGLGWVPFDPTPATSREVLAGTGAATSWRWPLRFWFDGLEHQWFKWVLYYDLDKQIGVLRGVSDMFSGGGIRAPRAGGSVSLHPLLPWAAGTLVLLALIGLIRGRRSVTTPETRLYLALRRSYERAGYAPAKIQTPLAFVDALHQEDAPSRREAERVVDLYLRARFAGAEIGLEGRAEMEDAVAAVRRGVRGGSPAVGAPGSDSAS